MKKIILFFVSLIVLGKTFCQTSPGSTFPKNNLTKDYYLQKSRNQKAGAWVLIGTGVITFVATGIHASNNLDLGSSVKHSDIVPIGLSIACVVGSVPLFIASGRNKRKAMNARVFLNIEKASSFHQTVINFHSYPAISVKFNF